jgi:hypothetical protein
MKTNESGIKKVSNRTIRANSKKCVGVETIEFLSFINEKNCNPEKFKVSCEIFA